MTEAREGEALAGVRVHEKEISLYVFLNYSVHIVFVQAVVGLSVLYMSVGFNWSSVVCATCS